MRCWRGRGLQCWFFVVINFIAVLAGLVRPASICAGASTTSTTQSTSAIRLDDFPDNQIDWIFVADHRATGAIGTAKTDSGADALQLSGDFNKGGQYVEAVKDLSFLDVSDIDDVRFKLKSENAHLVTMRLLDATGQTFQRGRVPLQANGQWNEIVLRPSEIIHAEHWGGANDGVWHGPPSQLQISLIAKADPDKKQPVLLIADIIADAQVGPQVQAAPMVENFEGGKKLSSSWKTDGDVTIDTATGFGGTSSLRLHRDVKDADAPCDAASPRFPVSAGVWQIGAACKTELQSPDDSYRGLLQCNLVDTAGNPLDHFTLAEQPGTRNWTPAGRRVTVPPAATAAFFEMRLEKAYGSFWVDGLSAKPIPQPPHSTLSVARIVLSSARTGNMFYPEDARKIDLRVECKRPLPTDGRHASWSLHDYWGAEYSSPATAALEKADSQNGHFAYAASLDLTALPLEIGKYYEVHVDVPEANGQASREVSSFVILPEAAANQYPPQEVPFTSRSWDDRVREHIELTNRLGIRICGLRSEWSAKPPVGVSVNSSALCEKLKMGFLTNCAIPKIEQHADGYQAFDESTLRAGVHAFVEKYGTGLSAGRDEIVSLGNEPHGDIDRVKENIAAYKVVYSELKKEAPGVLVLGTAVGTEEDYFQNGFGNYCDAYDFHVYESYKDVRNALHRYRELFAKYGNAKPIWATELGINGQGMSRLAIADELIRKFTVFFADGGANASWFGLAFPDTDGKLEDSAGDAFNVFSGKYREFAPRLDAVAYYNIVNGICTKKFVAEAHYKDDISDFLFRDKENHSLQVIWKEKGREDVGIPLPGVGKVKLVEADGRWSELDADQKSVTLEVGEDPMLLMYDGGPSTLPADLDPPASSITDLPAALVKGVAGHFHVALSNVSADAVTIEAPPSWTATTTPDSPAGSTAKSLLISVAPPAQTTAREGNLIIKLHGAGDKINGELPFRIPLTGKASMELLPVAASADTPAGLKLALHNQAAVPQIISWTVSLDSQSNLTAGEFGAPVASTAYFSAIADGTLSLAAHAAGEVVVPMMGIDPSARYSVSGTVNDDEGRAVRISRNIGGFAAVHRTTGPIKIDGKLDEADWQRAPVQLINTEQQYNGFHHDSAKWKGPQDLSAKVRFLWDDRNLYVAAEVTDDVFRNVRQDSDIWAGDSLQFLIDPFRVSAVKGGKYDYVVGVGAKGPQAWCSLSADASTAPPGEAKDIGIGYQRGAGNNGGHDGSITYELAIPWARLSPFKPAVDADLGLALGLNEDDGAGRIAVMSWFGNVHTKQVDSVGDLILCP